MLSPETEYTSFSKAQCIRVPLDSLLIYSNTSLNVIFVALHYVGGNRDAQNT